MTKIIAWQERERPHLTQVNTERRIEIKVKGEVRDNYWLSEYKEAMRAVERWRNRGLLQK
ncbi:MAG: hypothetical protein PHX08_16665 [Lachnospiraceae bacterium]|nr:hypothetical protein [Lachnospiraceae bacterium]